MQRVMFLTVCYKLHHWQNYVIIKQFNENTLTNFDFNAPPSSPPL